MTVDQMVEAIDAIETGGSDPENPWVECIELFTNGLKQQFLKKVVLHNFKQVPVSMFCRHSFLTTVTLNNEITSIQASAFQECVYLEDFDLTRITYIGNSAFSGCLKLPVRNLDFKKVETIDDYAFYNCTSDNMDGLDYVKFESIKAIGDNAFEKVTSLDKIKILNKPNSISNSAFINCKNLTEIHVCWSEGEVANAPWGATNATIYYNITE